MAGAIVTVRTPETVDGGADAVTKELGEMTELLNRLSDSGCGLEERMKVRMRAKLAHSTMLRLGGTHHVHHPSWKSLGDVVGRILDDTRKVEEERRRRQMASWRR